jgi:sigma-E factor negative regulatory protein RseA
MSTKNMTQEKISALADGEVPDTQLDMVFAALRSSEGREAWSMYHQIGDAMRSDDMAIKMSPDFTERLMKRLDEEPTIIAPVSSQPAVPLTESAKSLPAGRHSIKRFALPGMAAAAALAAMAFVAGPQLMVASASKSQNTTTISHGSTMLASAHGEVMAASSNASVAAPAGSEMLRDPNIDEYLLAHQRFSPSLYSTAQYARSATFAIDSDSNK